MTKYILIFILSFGIVHAGQYEEALKTISSNNKELKAYKEYLNSINLERRSGLLPSDPELEYSFLSGSGEIEGNKQEFIASQMFEFPTVYSIKSDIADLQGSVSDYQLEAYKLEIIRSAQKHLNDYIYLKKQIAELNKRQESSMKMLNTVQSQYDNGDVGILELNKAKSALSISKSNYNLALIELNSIESEITNLNGGSPLNLENIDYPKVAAGNDFDSLIARLKSANYSIKSIEEERKLLQSKLSLSKSGWFPKFGVGYRYENEPGIEYNGVQLQMSIPIFQNNNKVPKAESELTTLELKNESYESRYFIGKKILFDKVIELRRLYSEQKELVDFSQLDLNRQAYESGQISLTQYYIDNSIYYDIIDKMLEVEMELNKANAELMLELSF